LWLAYDPSDYGSIPFPCGASDNPAPHCDFVRLISTAAQSHAQLAAENLFL
jgi:hypothetical protein